MNLENPSCPAWSLTDLPGLFLSISAPTQTSILIYAAFLVWMYLAYFMIPGKLVFGLPLASGERRSYTTNGLLTAIITWGSFLIGSYKLKLFPATIIYENYAPLLTTVLIFCTIFSVYLLLKGYAAGAKKGNLVLDFWKGVELNPGFLGLDLKWFALKVAMTGWILINLSFAAKEYEVYGEISQRSILYQVFTFIYAADYLFFEPAMLTTWDIISENYGFMLFWGNFWFMWFPWSIQPFYLLCNREPLSSLALAAIVIVFSCGYLLFRTANSQKNDFKVDPTAPIWRKPPQTIGGKILISGWWGFMRKPNYLGDWLIALSFSFPTGFSYLFAYLYPIYLISLDTHRALRDDKKCSKKYGRIWTEYKKRVPYMLIPFIY